MKAITITNSKYQHLCYKSVKSFLLYNDIPVKIYFIGSEIENTCLKNFSCKYIDYHPSDIPKEYKWCKSVLKEKLKVFLEQTGDFLFFENDVFFYKTLDLSIFKPGISGVPEIADTRLDILNAGFLVFKNVKLSYTVSDIQSFIDSADFLPDEFFLSEYCSPLNFVGYDICYLNGTRPFIPDPVCVHCYGESKPFTVSKPLELDKSKAFHIRKILKLFSKI